MTVIAYSPLGRGVRNLRSGTRGRALAKVAEDAGKTEAQVALNWCISKDNVIAIPKSNSTERAAENCAASGWRLTPEQISLLENSR